jgi:hypothetical protein
MKSCVKGDDPSSCNRAAAEKLPKSCPALNRRLTRHHWTQTTHQRDPMAILLQHTRAGLPAASPQQRAPAEWKLPFGGPSAGCAAPLPRPRRAPAGLKGLHQHVWRHQGVQWCRERHRPRVAEVAVEARQVASLPRQVDLGCVVRRGDGWGCCMSSMRVGEGSRRASVCVACVCVSWCVLVLRCDAGEGAMG